MYGNNYENICTKDSSEFQYKPNNLEYQINKFKKALFLAITKEFIRKLKI